MAANIKDVAEKAGVSIATVSHVINDSRYVSDETKKLVLDAISALNYVPNSVARSLRRHQSNVIALIVPEISNYFFMGVAKAVEREIQEKDYSLILCNSREDAALERKQIDILKSQLVSGYIIAPVQRSFNYRSILPDPRYPLVFIDRKTDLLQADTVAGDDATAINESICQLIDLGHRRIAYIAGLPGISTTYDRLNAYYMALNSKGVEIDAHLVVEGKSGFESGYKSMEFLLSETDATAVFVSNSRMTAGVMHCLNEKKIKIPERMAVVGYDEYNWASLLNPPLSVIRQPMEDIGATAAKLVLERIQNKKRPYECKVFQAQLVRRQSY